MAVLGLVRRIEIDFHQENYSRSVLYNTFYLYMENQKNYKISIEWNLLNVFIRSFC